MSRPPLPPGQARNQTLRIRFSPAELEMIQARAGAAGQKTSEWARLWLLNQAPTASPAKTVSAPASGAKPHRCRREGEPLRFDYEHGARVPIYRCYGCDKELR